MHIAYLDNGTIAHMSQVLLRAFVGAIVALALAAQYRRATVGTRRRSAFGLGALAFALICAAQLLTIAGAPAFFSVAVTTVALALLVIAVVLLILAYQRGEMDEQLRRARAKIAEERSRYESPGSAPDDD
jgi:heme exporter protein D